MKPFSFIFIGDTHGEIDDFQKQKETIEAYNPEIVLAESLQDLCLDTPQKFQAALKRKFISDAVKFDEARNLIELCDAWGIKLIGIDLRNFGLSRTLQHALKGKAAHNQEKKIQEIVKKRQKHHLRKIQEYGSKTKKPIVVVIGAWHLQENSLLMRAMTNYKVIFPCDSRGSLLVEPTEENIRYCERIKR